METNFLKTDLGKIVGLGLHDHYHGESTILRNIELIKSGDELNHRLDRIMSGYNQLKKSIDYIYIEAKKLYNTDSNFLKTDIGKIIGNGIHDHAKGLGLIINYVSMIKQTGRNYEKFDYYLDKIGDGVLECKTSIDYIYTELKNYSNGKE